jgi:histidinol-phosphatase
VAAAEHDLALAHELADRADAITVERFRASDLAVETKPDLTPVSEADRAVEQAVREQLAAARPDDSVLGEEFGAREARGSRRWVVDPIDGTKSYVRGVPVWATLLALEQDGELVLGLASAPALGRRWWALRGSGAFLREGAAPPRPLHVSAVSALEDAQLCVADFDPWRETGQLEGLLDLSSRCWRTRGYGDFWQHMLVAEGAVDIAVDPGVSQWDLAAPLVIVQEAGGRLTDLGGRTRADGGDGVSSNGRVHAAALELLAGPPDVA